MHKSAEEVYSEQDEQNHLLFYAEHLKFQLKDDEQD